MKSEHIRTVDKKGVSPINGAAEYVAMSHGDKYAVVMFTPESPNHGSVIQICQSINAAIKAANRWQTKENRVVLKYPSGK